jgi:hypothetical protein
MRRFGAVGLVVVSGWVAACGGPEPAARVEGVTTTRVVTTTTTTALEVTTTTVEVSLIDPIAVEREPETGSVHDWVGQRYEFGNVRSVDAVDGRLTIRVARARIAGSDGVLRSGPELASEPVVRGPTRVEPIDEPMRRYALSRDLELLRISPTWVCGAGIPSWNDESIFALALFGSGRDTEAAITFNDEGRIIRIRLTHTC